AGSVQSFYMSGVTWTAGSGAVSTSLSIHNSSTNGGVIGFHRCAFRIGGTNGTGDININSNGPGKVVFDDTTVQFGAVGQSINVGNGIFIWRNTASAVTGAT